MFAIKEDRTVVRMDDFLRAIEKVMRRDATKPKDIKGVMFV